MCLTGEFPCNLVLLFAALFAANNGSYRWSSRFLAHCCSSAGSLQAEMLPRQIGTARISISAPTDEI
jgi:hypothetical protein